MKENNNGWIDVKDELPESSMIVRWLCEDGKEDIGVYFFESKVFGTIDLTTCEPITHWQKFPLNTINRILKSTNENY